MYFSPTRQTGNASLMSLPQIHLKSHDQWYLSRGLTLWPAGLHAEDNYNYLLATFMLNT